MPALLIGIEHDLAVLPAIRRVLQDCKPGSVMSEIPEFPLDKSHASPFLEELVGSLENGGTLPLVGTSAALAEQSRELCGYMVRHVAEQGIYPADDLQKRFIRLVERKHSKFVDAVHQEAPQAVALRTLHCLHLHRRFPTADLVVLDNRYHRLSLSDYLRDYFRQELQHYMIQTRLRMMYQRADDPQKKSRLNRFINRDPAYSDFLKKYLRTQD